MKNRNLPNYLRNIVIDALLIRLLTDSQTGLTAIKIKRTKSNPRKISRMAQVKINWKAFVRDLNLGHADNQDWLDLEQFVRVVVERECHVPQDSEFADECVQEIALKLHESKKIQKLKEARTPANYMYTVVKHSAADLVRSEDAEKRSIQKLSLIHI